MLHRLVILLCGATLVLSGMGAASAVPYYLTDLGPAGADTTSIARGVTLVNGSPEAVGVFLAERLAGYVDGQWDAHCSTEFDRWCELGPGAGHRQRWRHRRLDGRQRHHLRVLSSQRRYGNHSPDAQCGLAVGQRSGRQQLGIRCRLLDRHRRQRSCLRLVGRRGDDRPGHRRRVQLRHGHQPRRQHRDWRHGASSVGQLGQACKWTRSGSTWTMTPLVQLSQYNQSVASGINSLGDIVGGCFDYPQGGFPNPDQIALEFLPNGSVVRIGSLGNFVAGAVGINDSGVIVGNDSIHAFVNYTEAPNANVALSTLVSPVSGAGWTLRNVSGIDDNGDIVARDEPGREAERLLTDAGDARRRQPGRPGGHQRPDGRAGKLQPDRDGLEQRRVHRRRHRGHQRSDDRAGELQQHVCLAGRWYRGCSRAVGLVVGGRRTGGLVGLRVAETEIAAWCARETHDNRRC